MSEKAMTIDDIARDLGISKTTVSRAISGKGRIGNATRERVLSYIKEHDYKPNAMARGLAEQRTCNIAVVWPMDANLVDMPFFQKVLVGICDVTSREGYDVLITIDRGPEAVDLRRVIDNRKVDGVILTRTLLEDPSAAFLKESSVPFVTMGTSEDNDITWVDNDNEAACRELMEQLLEEGCKRFALIGGDENYAITGQRLAGYKKALLEAGLPFEQELCIRQSDFEKATGEILSGLLEKEVSCIVCMDDAIAREVLLSCHDMGIGIPQDIRIASFYSSQILENAKSPVTSIRFDERALGEAAAEQILCKIRGEKPRNVIVSSHQIMKKGPIGL